MLALLLAAVGPAAQAQLAVSPTIVEQRWYPGGLNTFTISFMNSGAQALDCTVSRYAMAVSGGGLPTAVDDAPRSCKDWLDVQPETFTLSPKQGRRLICRVRPPKDAAGGYYALLSCLGQPKAAGTQAPAAGGVGASIQFNYRVMSVVMLTVPGPDIEARIEAGQPLLSESASSGYSVAVPVRNTGNIHARMGGTVEVRSEAGQLVEQFPLTAGRGFLLPEQERLFQSRGEVNLTDGLYTVLVQLQPAEGGAPMQKSFPFYVEGGTPRVAQITDALRSRLEAESAGFVVSPAVTELSLQPGSMRMQAVEVRNLTRQTLTLQAHLLQWQRDAEGKDLVTDVDQPAPRTALPMLDLQQKQIELRPLSRQRVPFVVTMPRGSEGEYYGAVAFDREGVQLDNAPNERSRRSTLVRALAQGTGATGAQVLDFQALRQSNGAVRFTARLRNTGDLSIAPQPVFYIDDANNIRVGNVAPAVQPAFVQAGAEAVLSAEYTHVLDAGAYSAELALKFDPDKPVLTQRASFKVPAVSPVGAPPMTQEPE